MAPLSFIFKVISAGELKENPKFKKIYADIKALKSTIRICSKKLIRHREEGM